MTTATATRVAGVETMPAIDSAQVLNVLPVPILTIGRDNTIVHANNAAESFFEQSLAVLRRQKLADILPFGSPVLALVDDVRRRGSSVSGYRVAVSRPRLASERIADIFVAPMREDAETIVMMLQERTIAEKMDRQLTTRGAARSITALGSMLAHEIKNPLSGIRGAAQLIEQSASDEDRELTQLICDEADRIVNLVERMEFFGDERPIDMEPVNIHGVLDHVKRLAQSGFARHIRFEEEYDPSLPPLRGNRDQLVQVFLNLVKNAAEAIGPDRMDGQITLSTAFRQGMWMQVPGSTSKVSLPLEFRVTDNGPGVPSDILPDLFDPFVSTKAQGSGLGLALVAKIIGDHGGIVECESSAHKTTFRVLMPMFSARDGRAGKA